MYGIWNRLQYMLSPQFDIYEQVSKVVSRSVLDVGCGSGFGTHLFTRQAEIVRGIDLDESAINFADRAFSNGSISFSCTDIIECVSREPFDFITMIDVIEHIKNDLDAVKSASELLADKGVFICSTPNRLSRYRKADHHVREYSPDELKALLCQAFNSVAIVDYQLQPMESDYLNPMIAICQ